MHKEGVIARGVRVRCSIVLGQENVRPHRSVVVYTLTTAICQPNRWLLTTAAYFGEINVEINSPSLIPIAKSDTIPSEMRKRLLVSKYITLWICG